MPKPSEKIGFITERDKQLFQFLFESKVASNSQLRRSIFPEVSKSTACDRIAKLVTSGWLDKLGFPSGNTFVPIYNITEKTYRTHVHISEVNDRKAQLKSDVIGHDLALVDIRNRLEKLSSVKKFYTENVILSNYELANSDEIRDLAALRTDAVAELLIQEKYRYVVPIEYEASFKSKARCAKKLRDYYLNYDGHNVLFICRDEALLKRFKEIDRVICQEFESKMYFALIADVLNESEKVIFTGSDMTTRIAL